MRVESEEINSVLNRFLSIAECDGAAILSTDGKLIGFKSKKESIQSEVEGFLSNFIITTMSIVLKAKFGDLDRILIESAVKKIFIKKVQKQNIYIILFGVQGMNSHLASNEI